MSVSAIGSSAALAIQQLVSMRAQFDDLQRQLSTGQKSATYSGLGLGRGVTVSLNAQLAAISSYGDTISNVTTRISLMNTALGQMSDLAGTVKAAMTQANSATSNGLSTIAQQTAQSSLGQLIGLLNSQAGGRYLFSGTATDQPAVDSLDHILNGNGAQAGLKQLIAERNQADLGADGLGRLAISQPTATSVSLAEDAASPFGFKLASVSSSLTGATVTGPSGSPAALSVDFSGGNPNDGDTLDRALQPARRHDAEPDAHRHQRLAARRQSIQHRRDAGRDRRQSAKRAHYVDRQARRLLADRRFRGRRVQRFLRCRQQQSAAARRRPALRQRHRHDRRQRRRYGDLVHRRSRQRLGARSPRPPASIPR